MRFFHVRELDGFPGTQVGPLTIVLLSPVPLCSPDGVVVQGSSPSPRTSTAKAGRCIPGARQEAYACRMLVSSSSVACTSSCWRAFLTIETRICSSCLTCSGVTSGTFLGKNSSKNRRRRVCDVPSERRRSSSLVETEITIKCLIVVQCGNLPC